MYNLKKQGLEGTKSIFLQTFLSKFLERVDSVGEQLSRN